MEEVKFAPISKYGDVYTKNDWLSYVKNGIFIPSDGSGYWATKTQESDASVWNVRIPPPWATHVVWYNK